MDSNVIALIALGGFYLLRMLASRNKQKQGGGQRPQNAADRSTATDPSVLDDSLDSPTDFDEALAEIRRAFGSATAPPEPASNPAPPPAPAHIPWPSEVQETAKPSDSFHRVRTGRPDFEKRFDSRPRTQSGTSEDAFEGAPRQGGRAYDDTFAAKRKAVTAEDLFEAGKEEFRDPLSEHDHIERVEEVGSEPSSGPAVKIQRLATREALREAFVLKEIVGPPRSQKRSIRG